MKFRFRYTRKIKKRITGTGFSADRVNVKIELLKPNASISLNGLSKRVSARSMY